MRKYSLPTASGIYFPGGALPDACKTKGCPNRKVRQYDHCRFHLTKKEKEDMARER